MSSVGFVKALSNNLPSLDIFMVRLGFDAAEFRNVKATAPKVTVTGVKNAKLICIQDENSIETDCEDAKDDQTEKSLKLKQLFSANDDQTNSEKETKEKKPRNSFNMKRSSKSLKYLQKLPNDYALNIIQYKLEFAKHCTSIPMYKKTMKITPWILMDQISDQILNKALLKVAKEVEISEVVEKMYQSELQFC